MKHYKYLLQQVDILIFKNQVLQIMYLKHHAYETSKVITDKKPNETHKNLNPTKITQSHHTLLIHI